MLLTLPTLDPAIPATVVFDAPNAHHLRLAAAMTAAGQIRAADLRGTTCDSLSYSEVRALVSTAWTRELSALFEFQLLAVAVSLNLPNEHGSDGYRDPPDEAPICSLTLAGGGVAPAVEIGAVVLALEEMHTGLGCTAAHILDRALGFFCMPCTPYGAMEMAQMLYWMGEPDEIAAAESYGEDCNLEDIPSRAALFGEMPEWVYDRTKGKRLPIRAFAQAVKQWAGHPLGPFLRHLLDLYRRLPGRYQPERHAHLWPAEHEDFFDCNECFEPPALLYWNGDDGSGMERVFDDYYQYHMEASTAPYQRFVRFCLDPQEIAAAVARLRKTGRVCQALDRALVALNDWQASHAPSSAASSDPEQPIE